MKARPQFKAEYVITHNIRSSLEAAARAAAARLKMSADETEALVKHYLGFPYPQTGPGAKPVPPVLFCITKDSRDHCRKSIRRWCCRCSPARSRARRCASSSWGAGVHTYHKSEAGLPLGVAPPVAEFYVKAIQEGYFVV